MRLTLARGDVDLWLADYGRIDPGLLDGWLLLLTREERAQMVRFHFEDDRRRHLVTRALVRTTLSRYADVPAADWRFDTNKYGRPAVAACHGAACALSFNVSHTRSLIALALTREAALGVDVENFVRRAAPIEIADRFLSRVESTELLALDPARQPRRFFEYWTFKEAYIKARGMGL